MPLERTIGLGAAMLTGAGLLAYGLYQRIRLRASRHWAQTAGAITQAAVAVERDADSSSYSLAVSYDYVVGGVSYTGKRIAFSRRAYLRRHRAEAELERYPAGSLVTVYFDPARPAEAVLSREYPDNVLLIVCAVALLAIPVVAFLWPD